MPFSPPFSPIIFLQKKEEWNEHLAFFKSYSHCVVLSDQNVARLHGYTFVQRLQKENIGASLLQVPAGEAAKTFIVATECWEALSAREIDRDALLICLGGGAITDLGGYVAASYMRGIDAVYIPTTLLGMVDAAIGGKAAINGMQTKNLVGCFYSPQRILIAPHFLDTLPDKEFCSALAEVVKYAVVASSQFFTYLETHMERVVAREAEILHAVIAACCSIKERIVKADPWDRGERRMLNWGHTFAHALESITKYAVYLHGEAVSIGMDCAARVSHHLGYASQEFVERQRALCQRARLPIRGEEISLEEFFYHLRKDKKNTGGEIALILARGVEDVCYVPSISEQSIRACINC